MFQYHLERPSSYARRVRVRGGLGRDQTGSARPYEIIKMTADEGTRRQVDQRSFCTKRFRTEGSSANDAVQCRAWCKKKRLVHRFGDEAFEG